MPSVRMSRSATRALNARLDEQRELLGGVPAGDVHRRVGLGEPELLGLVQRLLVRPAVAGHPGQDDVARAVDDADEGVDPVGDEPPADGLDDRDAAAGTGLERDARVVLAGEGEQLRRRGSRAGSCWPSRRACRASGRARCTRRPAAGRPSPRSTILTAGSSMARRRRPSAVSGTPAARSAAACLAGSRTTTWRRSNRSPVRRDEQVALVAEDADDAAADDAAAEQADADRGLGHGLREARCASVV